MLSPCRRKLRPWQGSNLAFACQQRAEPGPNYRNRAFSQRRREAQKEGWGLQIWLGGGGLCSWGVCAWAELWGRTFMP